MSRTKIYLLGALSGVLMVLAYPPLPFPLLAFVAFVPLLFALEEKKEKPFLLVYLTFFIYCVGTNWWIGSWQKDTDSFLYAAGIAVSFGQPLFFMIPFIVYKIIRRRLGRSTALWLFPFIWTAFEWVRSFGDLSFTWISIGHTQIYNHYWVQAADVAGVWGLGFLITSLNMLFTKMIYSFRETDVPKITFKSIFKVHGFVKYSLLILLATIGPVLYGNHRIKQFNHEKLLETHPKVNAAVIQPNINPWRKWELSARSQIGRHMRIQDSLVKAVGPLDIAVWSETAITHLNYKFNFLHDFSFLKRWVDSTNTAVLSGFVDRVMHLKGEEMPFMVKPYGNDSNRFVASYNSAILIQPGSDSSRVYHKIKLTPFSERLPYAEVFSFALGWLEWGVGISSWARGEEQFNLELYRAEDTVKIAPIICIESIYPDYVRYFVIKGANILAVITNDGWFDYTWGPEQHYLISAMRAIECRRYLIRSANTGISGFIKPDGSSLAQLPPNEQEAMALTLPLLEYESLYVIFGDWFAIVAAAFTIIAFIYSFISKQFPVYKNDKP